MGLIADRIKIKVSCGKTMNALVFVRVCLLFLDEK